MGDELSRRLSRELDALRASGCAVFGPGPVSFTESVPRSDPAAAGPGMHVQIGCGSRFVEGFGATADEAVSDALAKLDGYPVDAGVLGPRHPRHPTSGSPSR